MATTALIPLKQWLHEEAQRTGRSFGAVQMQYYHLPYNQRPSVWRKTVRQVLISQDSKLPGLKSDPLPGEKRLTDWLREQQEHTGLSKAGVWYRAFRNSGRAGAKINIRVRRSGRRVFVQLNGN